MNTDKKRKITIFDVHSGERAYFRRVFKNLYGVEMEMTDKPLDETTAKDFSDTTIACVFITSKVSRHVIASLPNLELVATRSTGHEHIDLRALREHHVLGCNVPEYGESTVAEYTFTLLLALQRKLALSREQLDTGLVDHEDLTGFDLAGKTLGIIGLGRIGKRVAGIAHGFGMEVVAHDPFVTEHDGVALVDLEELLAVSDAVSLHAPLVKDNKHMINAEAIEKMKKGVVIINTARGSLIDTKALIDGLYSGHVAAAGLDAIEGEHLLRFDEEIGLLHEQAKVGDLRLNAELHVLMRMSNVIITPHNAFNTREALGRIRQATLDNIKQYLIHKPQNIIKT